jgi:hypothetical protein
MSKAPRFSPNALRVIEILTFPSVQLLDVTGPLQVFATANEIAASSSTGAAPYLLSVVAQGDAGVMTSSGLALLAQPLPPMESVPDTLLVAGGPGVEQAASDALLQLAARPGQACAPDRVGLHRRFLIGRGGRVGWATGGDPLVGLRRSCPAFPSGKGRARPYFRA